MTITDRFAMRCATSVVAGLLMLAPLGCSKKSDGAGGSAGETSSSPEGMGAAAGKIRAEVFDTIIKDLASKPEAADAKAKVTAVIDGAKTRLVELGRKREALPPADQTKFDQGLMKVMSAMSQDTFNELSDLSKHYRGTDRELANMIAEANILTQYANFDLLRKQLPKEAEKLGIK